MRGIAFLLVLSMVPGLAFASGRANGIGLVIGEPTAISFKHWFSREQGLQAGLGYSFGDYFTIFGDYLWHFPGVLHAKERFVSQLTPYLGVGGILRVGGGGGGLFKTRKSSATVGARVPLGIEWRPGDPPIGVFLELAPGIELAPAVDALVNGGIGVRYYF